MSSVKALPVGHVSSPMYVMMERSPHDANAQYKRSQHQSLSQGGGGHHSPPVVNARGYHQDPSCRSSASSVSYASPALVNSTPHMPLHTGGGANNIYTTAANHMYREPHFQVDTRQNPSVEPHPMERYVEQHQHQQHARRSRLNLRPTAEFLGNMERERYLDAIRYQYEREVALGVQYTNAVIPRNMKPQVVSVHTPSEMDGVQPGKRPRLAVEPKAPVHQPLVIDTRNIVIKKEPAYIPQVEAISPTLPSEEGRCDSPMRVLKENILGSINRLDKEINQIESQVTKLQKKMHELQVEASKPAVMKVAVKDISHNESKQMSIAQIIYSENRAKALDSHTILEKLGQKVEIPMYNQPSDTAVYHENKRKFMIFKNRLIKCFKKRHRERELRENHLTDTYSKLMQEWLKKMEKKESNVAKKAKDLKLREFFEKQFPELKKQREDKERITRVSQRIRSDAEWEEIIDGLQEQELEEKKMRSYAVIPPIILDSRQRRICYVNRNGLVEDLSQEYKEKQMLNIWTDHEKELFREKYLQHPKNFALISSYLERKTVADCVQYYYLSKKGEKYKQLLRKHNVRKRTRALVKPPQQSQPQQTAQNTGITTRQQEDGKTSINLSTTSTVATSNDVITTTTTVVTDSSPTVSVTSNTTVSTTSVTSLTNSVSSATVINTDSPTSVTFDVADSISCNGPTEQKTADSVNEKENTVHLPNNIRKKKEISKQIENLEKGAASDSDTASDHQNVSKPSQPCAICKMELDNFNQSRPLTKSNCSMFGIKESELVGDMRVCSSCRFKSVRRRCPIPSCKTPKRKVKRLRPVPGKLFELPNDAKEAIIAEFQIPPDVNKCCSACFNRITRKLESNTATESETAENTRWAEEEIEAAKKGLKQFGSDWAAVANLITTKSKEQCRNFYFNYKRKYGLEEILKEYRKAKGEKEGEQQEGKPPPMVTDEEESGETTSSCEEDNCVDHCSSDTASAPSPATKVIDEDKNEEKRSVFSTSVSQPNLLIVEDTRTQSLPHLESSPKCPADYDSSATVSADEGQNQNDVEMRDSSPRLMQQSSVGSHQHTKIPSTSDAAKKTYQIPLSNEADNQVVENNVPLVKTLLQDPNIGAAHPDGNRSSYLDQQHAKHNKEEPTCVRDLIYQAIEMSLQWPAKPGRNSSPIPAGIIKENSDVHTEPKKETEVSSVLVPPTAHLGSLRPSRPGSHTDIAVVDCEVQDLSKKAKSRDSSPPRECIKRDRVVAPARPLSESSSSVNHGHYYGTPPPAHCNQFRSSQPPPALSPHYVTDPHHETYFHRSGEPRNKTYGLAERPHSQPPHLVAQSPATMALTPPLPSHPKSVVAKPTVPPPPPLIASKPTQLSPKMTYKERLVTLPTGSITQGTPVNQQPVTGTGGVNLTPTRYEGFLRQLPPPPQAKDGGSITLGTPVQHEAIRRIPGVRAEASSHVAPAMYDPAVVEYYRHIPPGGQAYPFTPAYPGYPPATIPQRPPYANESQLSSKQIMIDFNTSKQMQLRRGSVSGEKEIKVSPRGAEPNAANADTHLHPMYPPMNYQPSSGAVYTNQMPTGCQPNDARFQHHRSMSGQLDRTNSPSSVEVSANTSFSHHPEKRSPGLPQGASRQNVIHRSITWGTGKPSVIQSPQSASPRTGDGRNEASSPATVRKSTPSPRHPQPLIYTPVPPSGHDAFNTLVNAAVAQPSLVVPKDGKGSPASVNSRQDSKSPRERPVVEGLEKSLIDMHQRPRLYTDSHRSSLHASHHEQPRSNNEAINEHRQLLSIGPDGHRYVSAVPHSNYEISRESNRHGERQQMIPGEHATSGLRLGNMREPFSREQFERQLRQQDISLPREREHQFIEKDHERIKPVESHNQNYSGHSQQSDLDNEASKIFSQSFQKDASRSGSSPRTFTAANLIDAIITRQINQNAEGPVVTKNSSVDIFNQYHSNYEESKIQQRSNNGKSRTEVVTIDDEPESEKGALNWNDRTANHGRSPPVTSGSVQNAVPVQYTGDKVYTLGEHIAAIISKDYNSPNDVHQSPPFFSNCQSSPNVSNSVTSKSSPYVPSTTSAHNSNVNPLEGIAAALPGEGILTSNIARESVDHNVQSTHSWKLRRALQQDKEHRSQSAVDGAHQRPLSAQAPESPISQDERQIIRVSQTASPSVQTLVRSSPLASYANVEPISPPSQTSESPVMENSNRNRTTTKGTPVEASRGHSSVWANNPSITGLLTTRHLYPPDYPENAPPVTSHYANSQPPSNSVPSNRPTHQQQQMGFSPLDEYVKNRIVEVMRTATDDNPESLESRRLLQNHSDEKEHTQHSYRFPQNSEREVISERPCSTGNSIAQLQSQRCSPAVSRYSPVPPRPSSAIERVPSRNSTPGDVSKHNKRTADGHHLPNDWRDSHVNISRVTSCSVSPNSSDAQDAVPRKKSRSENTFIPESSTDHAPVLVPESTVNIHRSSSHTEAPRLNSNNQTSDNRAATKSIISGNIVSSQSDGSFTQPGQTETDSQKFRILAETRSEKQWDVASSHDRSVVDHRLHLLESSNISPSSTTATVEAISPPSHDNMSTNKGFDTTRNDTISGNSPVTSSSVGQPESSRSSPVTSSQGQRNISAPHGIGVSSGSSGHYSSYSTPNGSVSSSSSAVFSSATSLQQSPNQHMAYSSFSGMNATYAYPYSALTMRSLAAAASTTHTSTPVTNSSVSVTGSHVSSVPINSSRNSPSPLSRNNQPPPLLSSQYEPLSDED